MRCVVVASFFLFSACGVDNNGYFSHEHGPLHVSLVADEAILAVANDAAMTYPRLDKEVRLDNRAAWRIAAYRRGDDGVEGTRDDRQFESLDDLVALSYVGPMALSLLLDYAHTQGYTDAPDGVREAAILAVLHDPEITEWHVDRVIGIDHRGATKIAAFRAGPDGVLGTEDDGYFKTMNELTDLTYVGHRALAKIFYFAHAEGYFSRVAAEFQPAEPNVDRDDIQDEPEQRVTY